MVTELLVDGELGPGAVQLDLAAGGSTYDYSTSVPSSLQSISCFLPSLVISMS